MEVKPRRRGIETVAKKAEAAAKTYGKPAVTTLAAVRGDAEKHAKGRE